MGTIDAVGRTQQNIYTPPITSKKNTEAAVQSWYEGGRTLIGWKNSIPAASM